MFVDQRSGKATQNCNICVVLRAGLNECLFFTPPRLREAYPVARSAKDVTAIQDPARTFAPRRTFPVSWQA